MRIGHFLDISRSSDNYNDAYKYPFVKRIAFQDVREVNLEILKSEEEILKKGRKNFKKLTFPGRERREWKKFCIPSSQIRVTNGSSGDIVSRLVG